MKLFALGCLASGALAKDIKQHKLKEKMMENRLKFDRDVIMNPGNGDEDEEWDPWDLEDEELQVRTRPPRTETYHELSQSIFRFCNVMFCFVIFSHHQTVLQSTDYLKLSRKWYNKNEWSIKPSSLTFGISTFSNSSSTNILRLL